MARQKSDFLKSLGTMLEIWKAIVDEVLSLGGNDENLRRILTSKTLRRQIAELIVSTASKVSQFTVWKTIKLGMKGLKTSGGFRLAFNDNGYVIGDWGNDILGSSAFTVSETEIEVDLVNISVGELGFKHGAEQRDIFAKALSLGLELCPNEVGPQLRLQYADEPKNARLIIGMEPITNSDGHLRMFFVATAPTAAMASSGMMTSVSCSFALASSSSDSAHLI